MRRFRTHLASLWLGLLCLGLSPGTEDWSSKLGVAERIDDLVCLSASGKVEAGDLVQLVGILDTQVVVAAMVEETDSEKCGASSRSALQGPFHRLRSDKSTADLQFPAIAVLDGRIPLTLEGTVIAVDLDGDGVGETFRTCTSQEGLHLTVWSGEPLTGTRRWHSYYYLGYDTEPTCTERDYVEGGS